MLLKLGQGLNSIVQAGRQIFKTISGNRINTSADNRTTAHGDNRISAGLEE